MAVRWARRQKRIKRVTLIANDRFSRPGYPDAVVSRPSLYTTNTSLPGVYSQRMRALDVSDCAVALYCTKLLNPRRAGRVVFPEIRAEVRRWAHVARRREMPW